MIAELIEESGEVPENNGIEEIVQAFFRDYNIPGNYRVYVVFLSDDGIREYNSSFFERNAPTDVISVLLDDELDGEYVWGEIYISSETAKREAEKRGIAWKDEVCLYVVHGLFHLLGYNDETPRDRERMWRMQLSFLAKFGFATEKFENDATEK